MREVDVTLVTEDQYEHLSGNDPLTEQVTCDELPLIAALEARGVSVRRVAWSNPDFNWRSTRLALLRSTWDYFLRVDEFRTWLRHAAPLTTLINPADLVEWNTDKRYLRDLADRGIRIVPTRWLPPAESLRECCLGPWPEEPQPPREFVLKPAVSAGAHLTDRFTINDLPRMETVCRERCQVEQRAMLLQPLQRSLLDRGELSLIVFGGAIAHAVQKLPKPGDYRVQTIHGGATVVCEPPRAASEFVQQLLQALPNTSRPLTYARVDLVEDNAGEWALMELELIEPALFLQYAPQSVARFADAIIQELDTARSSE